MVMRRDYHESLPMRRSDGLIPSINRMLWLLIMGVAVSAAIFSFIPELKRQRDQNARRDQLRAEIEKERAISKRLEREIELIQHDAAYTETIARDRLDLMKEGETIIRLEKVPSAPPAP
jgi:cell division protein FtsB